MPKIPRDVNAATLLQGLRQYGYTMTHQTGSHIRLLSTRNQDAHRITIPAHDPIKIGTLNAILNDVARYLNISKDELVTKLFG